MVTHATSTVRWAESDKRWEEGVRIRGGKEEGEHGTVILKNYFIYFYGFLI